jgi:hypothetical protein
VRSFENTQGDSFARHMDSSFTLPEKKSGQDPIFPRDLIELGDTRTFFFE